MNSELSLGSCFRGALEMAGISIPANLSIPDWVLIDEIPAICKELGLEWFGGGNIELNVEPVIVLYYTCKNKGHASFVLDIGPFLDHDIIGLVRFTSRDEK